MKRQSLLIQEINPVIRLLNPLKTNRPLFTVLPREGGRRGYLTQQFFSVFLPSQTHRHEGFLCASACVLKQDLSYRRRNPDPTGSPFEPGRRGEMEAAAAAAGMKRPADLHTKTCQLEKPWCLSSATTTVGAAVWISSKIESVRLNEVPANLQEDHDRFKLGEFSCFKLNRWN